VRGVPDEEGTVLPERSLVFLYTNTYVSKEYSAIGGSATLKLRRVSGDPLLDTVILGCRFALLD